MKRRTEHCFGWNIHKLIIMGLIMLLSSQSLCVQGAPRPTRVQRPHASLNSSFGGLLPVSRFVTQNREDPAPKQKGAAVIPAPVIIMPMIAVPPRDQIPGSTKGLPYKVRIAHPHKRRNRGGGLGDRLLRSGQALRRHIFGAESGAKHEEAGSADAANETVTVDLHGGIVGVGEYFSIIEIGGKEMRVQVDTGSSTLAVPMEGCRSCSRKSDRRYALEDSEKGRPVRCDAQLCAVGRCSNSCPMCSTRGACCSTERPEDCGFSLRYADGSTLSGALIQDEMVWGKLRCNVTFGGILRNSENFERSEVDGILGMAYKALACSPSCFDPPFDSLVKSGQVDDVFSICMTSTGGKLMLGGLDQRVIKSDVQYVDMTHVGTERYYRVSLGGQLWLGDEKVSMPNFRSAIVDTGTTLIVTSTKTFTALKREFQKRFCDVPELCEDDSWFQSGMCVSLSEDDLKMLPTLTMELGGVVRLSLRPQDYMLRYDRGGKTYRCVGIMGMDGLGGMVVLGNTLMQRYVTVYDRHRGRLGFAESARNCGD